MLIKVAAAESLPPPTAKRRSTAALPPLSPSTAATPASPRELSKRWTEEEDAILIDIVNAHGAKNWKDISARFCARSPTHRANVQCLQRWKKVLCSGLKKGKWSKEEDATLMRLVLECTKTGAAAIRWPKIAQKIPGRTSKQCRERWKCNLDPKIVRDEFSAEEDAVIVHHQAKVGNKWAHIAQYLPGRTENAIKARFNFLKRKAKSAAAGAAEGKAAKAVRGEEGDDDDGGEPKPTAQVFERKLSAGSTTSSSGGSMLLVSGEDDDDEEEEVTKEQDVVVTEEDDEEDDDDDDDDGEEEEDDDGDDEVGEEDAEHGERADDDEQMADFAATAAAVAAAASTASQEEEDYAADEDSDGEDERGGEDSPPGRQQELQQLEPLLPLIPNRTAHSGSPCYLAEFPASMYELDRLFACKSV